MSDSTIINTIRKFHRTLFNIFVFILVSISFLLLLLDHGIKLPSVNTEAFKAEKVYIKWDKKLTLRIKKLNITTQTTTNSKLDNLKSIKELLQVSALFFNEISVDKLSYENNSVTFSYKNGNLSLKTPYLGVDAKIEILNNKLLATFKAIDIKQYKAHIYGKLVYNHKNGKNYFTGQYSLANEINGSIVLQQYKNNVYVRADSKPFKSLTVLQDIFNYDDNLHKWIGVKSDAESFRLKELTWQFNMAYPKKILKKLHAKIRVEKLKYRFSNSFEQVTSSSTDLIFKNEQLYLYLNNPKYLDRKLDGSYLNFHNLLDYPELTISLKSKTPLDENMLNILRHYRVKIPLTQLSNSLDTDLKLTLNLIGKTRVKAIGDFKVKDADFRFEHFTFHINKSSFHLRDAMLFIEDGNISIDNYVNLTLNGELNTSDKSARFNLLLNSSDIEVLGHSLIENVQIPLSLEVSSYNGKQYFYVDEFQAEIGYKDEEYDFTLSDLQALYPYSPLLRFYNIEFGNIRLQTSDFLNSAFYGEVYHNDKLFSKNNNPKNFYKFYGFTNKDGLELSIDDDINLKIKDTIELDVKNYDVNAKALQKYRTEKSPLSRPIIVHTENSSIYVDQKHKILSDTLKINFDENSSKVTLKHNEGNISIETNASSMKVRGSNLDDDFVKALSGFNNFEDGNFRFESDGNRTHYTTNIDFNDVIVRNLALYNNLMAFINTVPALLTFSEPGFNDKGYLIKKGHVTFRRIDDYIIIDNFILKGVNTNASAKGIINLKDETLNILLSLETIKDLAKTIGAIPIAGYLILGNDKTIRTRIRISGNIKNPKIRSQVGKDVLEAPINIIKRTFKLPSKLLNLLR